MEDDEDKGEDSKQWVSKEIKDSKWVKATISLTDLGVNFTIRPQSGGSNEDE
jgi:hypothetical protein